MAIPKNQKNSKYWDLRSKAERDWITQNIKNDEEFNAKLKDYYDRAILKINRTIESELSRLAKKENIDINELKQRVKDFDVHEYSIEAKRIVEEADKLRKQGRNVTYEDFSKEINERLRLYNATMRINRQELLKSLIGLNLIELGANVDADLRQKLTKDYTDEITRQAGILGEFKHPIWTGKEVAKIVMAQTGSANFSKRIWANQDALKARLDATLSVMLIQGQNPRKMAQQLRDLVSKEVTNARYATERIARTESARVQTQAQLKSFRDNGYKFCKWHAEPSACKICKKIAENDNGYGVGVYRVDEVPNLPAHPNCRCGLGAYWVESIKNFERSGNYRIADNSVDINYLHSKEFKDKFNKISDNSELNSQIQKYAVAILTHRQRTDGEDSYIFNLSGKVINKTFGRPNNLEVGVSKERVQELLGKYGRGNLIGLHNHPTNIPPTGSDFMAAGYRGYRFGIIICHNGNLYKYKIEKPFQKHVFDKNVEKYMSPPYNLDVEKAFDKVVSELERFGVKCEKL